jgi:hypothetical protein
MKTKSKKCKVFQKFSRYSASTIARLTALKDITSECCGNFLYGERTIREYNQYLLETSNDGNNED